MSQRIKGQEVSVILTRDGVTENELTDISNFNAELEMEQISQGYLGMKTELKDDIFKGVKGDMELNIHSSDIFPFAQAVLDRTKRNTPDVVFNIAGVFSFPNGETVNLRISDVKFGALPFNTGSRADYVKVKLDFVAEDVAFDIG